MLDAPTEAVGAKIVIYESELDRMAGWAAASPRIETGGDLFGYRTRSGVPVVTVALGPGPRARHEVTAFFQDTEFLRRTGTALNQSHGLQYIGEWHSHHMMGLAHPSGGDCETVANVFKTQPFDDFILCIVNLRERSALRNRGSLEMSAGAFHFLRGRREPTTAAWVVLECDSPIAAQVYDDPALGLRSSKPQRIWSVPRTTLDAPLVSQQAAPLDGLMNQPEGNAFFQALYQGLNEEYGTPEMRVLPGGDVTFRFRARDQPFDLSLPSGFPELRATLTNGDEETRLTRLLPANGLHAARFLSAIRGFVGNSHAVANTPEPDEVAPLVEIVPAPIVVAPDLPVGFTPPLASAAARLLRGVERWWAAALLVAFSVLAFAGLAWELDVALNRIAQVDQQVLALRDAQSKAALDQTRAAEEARASMRQLNTAIAGINGTIEALNTATAGQLKATAATINDRIAGLSADVARVTSGLTSVTSGLTSMTSGLTSLGDAQRATAARMDSYETSVTEQLDLLHQEIAALRQDIAATQAAVAQMPDRLAPLSASVSADLARMQQQIDALDGRLSAIATSQDATRELLEKSSKGTEAAPQGRAVPAAAGAGRPATR